MNYSFQSLFSWKLLFDYSLLLEEKISIKRFQSLFSWKLLFDLHGELLVVKGETVSILVFVEATFRPNKKAKSGHNYNS